jgi:Protein of unknown function (DUF3987)
LGARADQRAEILDIRYVEGCRNMTNGKHNAAKYIQAALDGEIAQLANVTEGRNNALFKSAAALGSLVDCGLDETAISDGLIGACNANGLTGDDGIGAVLKTISSGFSTGRDNPRDIPANDNQPTAETRHHESRSRHVAAAPKDIGTPKAYPAWTPEEGKDQPASIDGSDEPAVFRSEIGRYVFRRGGELAQVKIKTLDERGKRFIVWYKATRPDGSICWQARKPKDYEELPYSSDIDAYDPELAADRLWLPEGERDVDTLVGRGMPALTFGGTSGLPLGWTEYADGRDVVVCADNDQVGRDHAEQKAAQCSSVAKSVKVLHFTDTAPGGDVTDWLNAGHTEQELSAMVDAATPWQQMLDPAISAISAISASLNDGWSEPEWSIMDGRRGDLPDFPIDELSPEWQNWVTRAAHGAGATLDHVAVPLLTVASSLIGTGRRVAAAPGFSQPLSLWTMTIGDSGTSKSPGLETVRRPLRFIDNSRKGKVDVMRRAHETRVEAAKLADARWKQAIREAADAETEIPSKPAEADIPLEFVAPRLFLTNVTIERVPPLLQSMPKGLLAVYEEMAGFLLNMGRYSKGQDGPFWLEAWTGGPYLVERQKGTCEVDCLLIGITGGVQPDVLSKAFDGEHDGMCARFCYSWPLKPKFRRLSDDVAEIEQEIVNALTRLIDLPVGDAGEFKPRVIPLSSDARERFEDLRRFANEETDRLEGRERDCAAKGPAHVLRLAATLAFMEWSMIGGDEPSQVEERHMKSAVSIFKDYFHPHSFAAMRIIGVSDQSSDERRVLRWIKEKRLPEVSIQDARRFALSGKPTAKQTESLFVKLVEAQFLREVKLPVSGAGKPKRRWQVNPRLLAKGVAEIADTAEIEALRRAA